MNKDNKLVPKLRFPEFVNEGEWKRKCLNSVSDVIMGSSPSSSAYNENNIGLPLLQGNADIKNRLSAPRIYTTEVTKQCKIDDILLSVRAPVGTVAKSLHNACIGRGISAIRTIYNNSQEYLYQWLISYESSWQNISQGGTFDAVNSDDIRNLSLPIPKPKEQQKIASCLSSLDELIAAHTDKLEALKDHKKGLMQQLFPAEGETVPKLRFKEFEKDGEWVEKRLGNVANVVASGDLEIESFSIAQTEEHIYPIYSNSVSNAGLYGFCSFSKYKKGSVTITARGTLGIAFTRSNDFVGIGRLIVVSDLCDIDPNFFKEFWNHSVTIPSENGGIPQLTAIKTKSVIIKTPSIAEQQKIADFLSSIDDEIAAQKQKIEGLKEHKKGLMQGLFPVMVSS